VAPQAGLFSAVLTAFVVDSKQDLKPSPADETVYYLRQHSTILSQISVQLSSIAPQVSIPPTPPPPFPAFSPLASDVRVNVFWFMALAFSLLAALLAILVQQWVRNYMHVFQRYGDPLKSSRLRQYLYEGCERWYMPRVAEAVPGFLHVSLFLFFAGLGNSLLNINTKVALSTIVPIGVSGLLYIFMTFAPIIYPQSPYQNSFSGFFWYLFQKLHGRRFRDRGTDGEMKSLSTNMAQGQMQLATEVTEARMDRDVRAIRWLIDDLTEDAEMETFLSAIPGSFNTDWGMGVWRRVGEHHKSEDHRSILRSIIHLVRKPSPRHPPTHATTPSPIPDSPSVHPHSITVHIRGKNVLHELSNRVARSVELCKNRTLFPDNYLWRKRTRACMEDTASLVFRLHADFAWFGGISKLLGDIGSFEKIRELSLSGTDELFVMRWTCLSLVAIPLMILEDNRFVQDLARRAMESFATADETGNDDALEGVQKINETLQKARDCLNRLYNVLPKTEDLTEVEEILRGHESQISQLEQINFEVDRLGLVDDAIFKMQADINDYSFHQIVSQFPGVLDDRNRAPIPFNRFVVELTRDPRKLQFIRPGQTLTSMCSPTLTLRNILKGQGDADAYNELLKDLHKFRFLFGSQGDGMQRQLWRLQDLRDGGGLGFTVELFFLALSQLLSTSSSKESHSALYTDTFRVIASDWSEHKNSLGTQNLLLYIAMSRRLEFEDDYPAHIVDEFLLLLGNIFEGQTGPHIDNARHQLESFGLYDHRRFRERVLRILPRVQAQSLAS
jgi:hypothetical protein